MAWRITRTQQIGALAVGMLLLVPPFPSTVTSDFTLEPGTDVHVRATVSGMVQQVLVREGDRVQPGQLLAVLTNPQITSGRDVVAQELAEAGARVRTAQQDPIARNPGAAIRERARLEQEFAVAQRNAGELEIRAPHEGTVTTPNVDQKVGQYLDAGDEFCRIVDRREMKARILVRDWQLNEVRAGANVRMKVSPFPYRTYAGRIGHIQPAAAADQPVANTQHLERLGQNLSSYFAVVVEFPDPDGSLREGMTGTAKIYTGRSPIAWKWGRDFSRWFRSQVW